uniref:Uncharacterized protein n=1 Tax=Agaricus bisporus spherical virus TaxID=1192193 RepID=A0A1Q1M965_9VIRU|nr:hypothetical protein [Agaricus bisporus spherical virus]
MTEEQSQTPPDQQETSFVPTAVPAVSHQTRVTPTVPLKYRDALLIKMWDVSSSAKTQSINDSMLNILKDDVSGKGQVMFSNLRIEIFSDDKKGTIAVVIHGQNEGPANIRDAFSYPNKIYIKFNPSTAGNSIVRDIELPAGISNQITPPDSRLDPAYLSVFQKDFTGMVTFTWTISFSKLVIFTEDF